MRAPPSTSYGPQNLHPVTRPGRNQIGPDALPFFRRLILQHSQEILSDISELERRTFGRCVIRNLWYLVRTRMQ